ncbi:YwgA family protein, partial [Klebsiella pneumoniae]|nr:YwgA family protein [Klebsiella pneumoniae]
IKPYIDDVNRQSSRFLELVATILYFEGLDQHEIREKVFTIKSKQRYTDEEFDEAVAYIEKLRSLC